MQGNEQEPVQGSQGIFISSRQWLLCTTARVVPNTLTTLAVAGLILGSIPGPAYALDAFATPTGGKVVGGKAAISSSAGSVIINQKTSRAVIDWKSFNIGTNSKTQFKQPSANSIAVNRVVGGKSPTQILGSLKSNGQIVILDANGVMFGQTAVVDVGGIVASTGAIDTKKFMSGTNQIAITGIKKGKVENNGTITVHGGGLAAFVAPQVVNNGTITANLGAVELASGSSVTVDFYGDQLISLKANAALTKTLVENSGSITADGGRVALTAQAAKNVVDDVVNMSGVIQAQSVGVKNGKIVLSGGAGGVSVTGDIDARGLGATSGGGFVQVSGKSITLDGAHVDASGTKAGGEVYIGGGLFGQMMGINTPALDTHILSNAVINADALQEGNGGTIVVWGDRSSEFYGLATARGGAQSGNGGLVEVSTGEGVVFDGIVDTTAANGLVGKLLIDPATVTIGNSADLPDGSYLNAGNLADTLAFTSVEVMATNDIIISESIDLENSSLFGRTIFDFTLTSSQIDLNHDISIGDGNVFFNAATVNMDGVITSNGALIGGARLTGIANQVNVLSNAASLQQAIDISSISSPAMIDVAAGQYAGNLNINKTLTLRGNGGDNLAAGADAAAPEIVGTVADGDLITISAANVTVEGFKLSAPVNGGLLGDSDRAIVGSGDGVTLHNNTFTGFDVNGIEMSGSDNLSLHHNTFTDIGNDAISVSGGAGAVIANNVISAVGSGFGAGGNAISVSGNTGAQISGNTVAGAAGGAGAVGSAIFVNNSANAIIQGNTITGDAGFGAQGGDGIEVSNSAGVNVSGNTISGINGGTGAGDDGISVTASFGATIDGNTIQGTVDGVGALGDGVFVDSSDNATVTNNSVFADAGANSSGSNGPAFNIVNSNNTTASNNQDVDQGDVPDDPPDEDPPDEDPPDEDPPDEDPPEEPDFSNHPLIKKIQHQIDELELRLERLQDKLENSDNPRMIRELRHAIEKTKHRINELERKLERTLERLENDHGEQGWHGQHLGVYKNFLHNIFKHLFRS